MRPSDGQVVRVKAEQIDGLWLESDCTGVYLQDPTNPADDRILVPAPAELLPRGATSLNGWAALSAHQFQYEALDGWASEVECAGRLGWRLPGPGAVALWQGEWVGFDPARVQQEVFELAG